MNPETITLALTAGFVGVALGGALVLWLKSRPVSTKAELLRALAGEAKLIGKLPGAAQAKTLADEQADDEVKAAAELAEAVRAAAQ